MAPPVDLSDLQNTIGDFIGQHKIVAAAGPMTATFLVRMITKNKLITGAVVAGSTIVTVQMVSGSALQLMRDQFGYLQSLLSGMH